MNSDKFNTLTSNLVEFVAGERPSADKFNAVNKYFSRSLRELANAIGPIYDKSFPYFDVNTNKETYLTAPYNVFDAQNRSRPLDIANLARLIGPASNLNPRIVSGIGENLTEEIPSGVTSYRLKYKNHAFANIPIITGLTENDYVISTDNQVIYFNTPTGNNLSVSYRRADYHLNTVAFGGPNYAHATFNVIPDPNSSTNLIITDETTYYRIQLPTINAQQSSLNNLSSSNINDDTEPHLNQQLKLPEWMWNVDLNLGQTTALFTNGTIIPPNFLYLKNRTTGEVYLDAVYTFVSSTEINVSNVDLCLDENPEHKFCIVTVGTDITTSIDDLRVKWFKHTHDGTFGESPIDIKDLAGIFVRQAPRGVIRPSSIASNHLPMYLHRDGYQVDSTHCNGNNAMRGDLVMGLASFDPLDNTTSIFKEVLSSGDGKTSKKLYFGSEEAYIQRDVNGHLKINLNDNDTNSLIYATSPGGVVIQSQNGNHLGTIQLDADTIQLNSDVLTRVESDNRVDFQINGVNFGEIVSTFNLCVQNEQTVNIREQLTSYDDALLNDEQFYISLATSAVNPGELIGGLFGTQESPKVLNTPKDNFKKKKGVRSTNIFKDVFTYNTNVIASVNNNGWELLPPPDNSNIRFYTDYAAQELFTDQNAETNNFVVIQDKADYSRRSIELFKPDFDSYYELYESTYNSPADYDPDAYPIVHPNVELDLIINRGSLYLQKIKAGFVDEIKSTFYFKVPNKDGRVFLNYGGKVQETTLLNSGFTPPITASIYYTKSIYDTNYSNNVDGSFNLSTDVSVIFEGQEFIGYNDLTNPIPFNHNINKKNPWNVDDYSYVIWNNKQDYQGVDLNDPQVRFSFIKNRIYKVEETYFNGKFWINITGA